MWRLLMPIMWLLSLGYRLGLTLSRWTARSPIEVAVPVLSVGNVTVGGTGKTPMVSFVAGKLIDMGFRVGIVASGYGRAGDEPFLQTGSTLSHHTAEEIGDEVKLLATWWPTARFAIDRTKALAAQKLAATGNVHVIIVDDGFQHHQLRRSLDLVVFDSSVEPRLHHLLPWGVLREPMAGLQRADVVVVTREEQCTNRPFVQRVLSGLPDHTSRFSAKFRIEELIGRNQRIAITSLHGKRVLLFAGIGNFSALHRQIESLCGGPVAALELADHQTYDRDLVDRIRRTACAGRAEIVVTTEKDWMKVSGFDFGREIYYVALKVELEPGGEQLAELLVRRLGLTITGH